jgi:small-conductance mechanosensitive channel
MFRYVEYTLVFFACLLVLMGIKKQSLVLLLLGMALIGFVLGLMSQVATN